MSKKQEMIHEYSSEVKFAALQIIEVWGLILRGKCLAKALGYPSTDALRRAIGRGKYPLTVRKDEGGMYTADAYDIAEYVVKLRRCIKM